MRLNNQEKERFRETCDKDSPIVRALDEIAHLEANRGHRFSALEANQARLLAVARAAKALDYDSPHRWTNELWAELDRALAAVEDLL